MSKWGSLESGSKHSIEESRYGWEGQKRETWEGYPSYLGDSSKSMVEEAEEINRILANITLDNEDQLQSATNDDVQEQTRGQIEDLKDSLNYIFGDATPPAKNEENESINISELEDIDAVEEEPQISLSELSDVGVVEEKSKVHLSELSDIEKTEEEVKRQEQLKTELEQAHKEIEEKLNWASKQPNEPTFSSTVADNIETSPAWTQDQGVSGYTEQTIEQVRAGLNLQSQKEEISDKSQIIHEIIDLMNSAGEIDMQYAPISDISKRLQMLSMEELEQMKNQYLTNSKQNIQNVEASVSPVVDYMQSPVEMGKHEYKISSPVVYVDEESIKKYIESHYQYGKVQEITSRSGLEDTTYGVVFEGSKPWESRPITITKEEKEKIKEANTMVEAMANNAIDIDGNQINNEEQYQVQIGTETIFDEVSGEYIEVPKYETQSRSSKQMGFTGFQMLAMVSFAFSGLILAIGSVVIAFMK